MTANRPTFLLKLLAPLAAFACVFGVLVAFGGADRIELPGRAAGVDIEISPDASTDRRIAILQGAVRDGIGGAEGYAALGDAYLQKARENGDPSFYSRAERSFDAARRRDARSMSALLGAGTLAGLRHDFREQLRRGLEAQRLMPELVAPYPVIADAQIELGRYRAAERTLQRFLDLKPNLASYSRVSYFRELNGDLDGAVEAMRLAVSAGAGVPENIAYVQTLLGDLELQRGRRAAARAAYRGALARLPRYAPAEAGLARVELAAGDLDSAASRLRSVAQRLPLTGNLILLAETNAARGDERAAEVDLEVVRTQQRLLRAAGTRPDAELVVFEANYGDAGAAVELGRRLWREAPSVRSADALGWALTRAGRPGEGLAWARRALRLGSRDPLFHLHAGLAAKAAARAGTAARELRTALSGRTALSPLRAREARAALADLQ
jgi:tetratricopeptide (TPR) repeat protein